MSDPRGVTLTELLITIIIISILSVVVATNLTTGTEAADKAQLQRMMGELNNALNLAAANRPIYNGRRDYSYWERYLQPGDVEKIADVKDYFGFVADEHYDWYSHPASNSEGPIYDLPGGVQLPLKVWLRDSDDWQSLSVDWPLEKFVGVPYLSEP